MAALIDTSVLIEIERKYGTSVLLTSMGEDVAFLAAITASELLQGVHRADTASRRQRRARFVDAVLSLVWVLPFGLEEARVHARLWAELSQSETRIGANDSQIAATALAHELPLMTHNEREFRRVQGLELISWSS